MGALVTMEVMPGMHIAFVASKLVELATANKCRAMTRFNDIAIHAWPNDDVNNIVEKWTRKHERRRRVYLNSAEGRAESERYRQNVVRAQNKIDALMVELHSLNFDSTPEVLRWMCGLQDPSDHTETTVPVDKVLETFAAHGYFPGMNVGADYQAGNPTNEAGWIIGQGLSGLQYVGAIHGVIHKFANAWLETYTS